MVVVVVRVVRIVQRVLRNREYSIMILTVNIE